MWVSPFGYLRINGYLLLPAAFRSLSRPSSAPSARASALRPFCLTAPHMHSVACAGFLETLVSSWFSIFFRIPLGILDVFSYPSTYVDAFFLSVFSFQGTFFGCSPSELIFEDLNLRRGRPR